MRLRRRMTIAVGLICVLPLILVAMATFLIVRYQVTSIATIYNVETDSVNVIQNPLILFGNMTKTVYREIRADAIMTPKLFEDTEYLEETNEKLQSKYSFLVVRKGGSITYCGDREAFTEIENQLPSYGSVNTASEIGIYLQGDYPMLVKQTDFLSANGVPTTLFVITDANNLLPQWKTIIIQAIVSFVLVLTFTATALIIWLYRSILQPLTVLRVAANQIKEGNLNYEIHGNENDEIGQLQNDFELMREHLKGMSDKQILFEQDSRDMLSNISHDLKTPLTAIKGYTEGLIDGVADTKEKQEKYLRTIYTKACAMEQLVEELNFFSKIDNKAFSYNFQTILIHAFLTDCIEELSLDLEVRGIRLAFSSPCEEDVKVVIDPEALKRVISNIVGNSVKYMDKEQGEISIRLLMDKEFVWITIEDNGSGIKQKDIPHIFDRFYRGDTARSTKQGGSGLGLAIVKSIVEDHGGTIEADSMEGKGTTIRFSVPREKTAVPEIDEETRKKMLWIKS